MEDKFELLKNEDVSNKVVDLKIDSTIEEQFIGEALDDDEKINLLMATNKPEIIILVGFAGYGKTSFISSFYQQLIQSGEIKDFKFYDSDTLTGLERRAYLRRLTDRTENIAPETKRTLRGEPYLLTFHFYNDKNEDKLIVVSDHSGEDYAEYAGKKDKVANDILLSNADRIMFFIDTDKLLSKHRLSLISQYSQLLNNMKNTGIFDKSIILDLIFNKIDLVHDKQELFEKEQSNIINKFQDIIGCDICGKYNITSNVMNKNLSDVFYDMIVNSHRATTKVYNKAELDWTKFI